MSSQHPSFLLMRIIILLQLLSLFFIVSTNPVKRQFFPWINTKQYNMLTNLFSYISPKECNGPDIKTPKDLKGCTSIVGDIIWKNMNFFKDFGEITEITFTGSGCIVLENVQLGGVKLLMSHGLDLKRNCNVDKTIRSNISEVCDIEMVYQWLEAYPNIFEIYDPTPCMYINCNDFHRALMDNPFGCENIYSNVTTINANTYKLLPFIKSARSQLVILNAPKLLNLSMLESAIMIFIQQSPNLEDIIIPNNISYDIQLVIINDGWAVNLTKFKEKLETLKFKGHLYINCNLENMPQMKSCEILHLQTTDTFECEKFPDMSNIIAIAGTLVIKSNSRCLFDFDVKLPKLKEITAQVRVIVTYGDVKITKKNWKDLSLHLIGDGFVFDFDTQSLDLDTFYQLRWTFGWILGAPVMPDPNGCWFADMIFDDYFPSENQKCKTFYGDLYVNSEKALSQMDIKTITGCLVVHKAKDLSFLPKLKSVGHCIYPANKYLRSEAGKETNRETGNPLEGGFILKSRIKNLIDCLPSSEYERWHLLTMDNYEQLREAGERWGNKCKMACYKYPEIGCDTLFGDLEIISSNQELSVESLIAIHGSLTIFSYNKATFNLLNNLTTIISKTAPAIRIKNNPNLRELKLPKLVLLATKDKSKPIILIEGNAYFNDTDFLNKTKVKNCSKQVGADCYFDSFYQTYRREVHPWDMPTTTPEPSIWKDSEWIVVPVVVFVVMMLALWIGLYIKERKQANKPVTPDWLTKRIKANKLKKRAKQREILRLEQEKMRLETQIGEGHTSTIGSDSSAKTPTEIVTSVKRTEDSENPTGNLKKNGEILKQ